MRNIYTDEAGTAANEAVSVVLALIVNPDTQWFPVVAALAILYQRYVPDQYRTGFAFHARKLSGQNKYPGWDYEDRKSLMRAVMTLPSKFNIPIALGATRRGRNDWSKWPEKKMNSAQVDHFWAFTLCMGTCNRFLGEECSDELGQVIAEDIPEMRRYLRKSVNLLRSRPLVLDRDARGPDDPPTHTFRGDRMIDEVHFLDRSNAPFLQIADACAFGLRRYITGHDKEDFVKAVLAETVPGLLNDFGLYSALYSNKEDRPIPQPPFPPPWERNPPGEPG
jgi:Protein of unknown function (DUF3800)